MVNEDVTTPPQTRQTITTDTTTDAVSPESATIRIAPRQRNADEEAVRMAEAAAREATTPQFPASEVVFELEGLSCYYGSFRAVRDISLQVPKNKITALIGPSGCGKSTLLRSFNRMNDLIDGARIDGSIRYHGVDLYDSEVDPVEVRRRIGMVFQKPNPFPKSIYDNVAFGPKVAGYRGRDGRARRALAASGGDLGRGEGQAQGAGHSRCRADSSSGCASRGRSPSSRTSSSWTSRARPSTRSRR